MLDSSPVLAGSLKGPFQAYERDIRVRNYQLCGILAAIFMVAGSSLDWVVFGVEGVRRFFLARVLSAVVMMVIWWILSTAWGKRMHRLLGLMMAMPLITCISWMIYVKQGAESPYYAGLNLVMLGAAILMRWTLQDSILVVLLTVLSYLMACYYHGPIDNRSIFFNNLYFLFVTGVFTTAGTWFYNTIRFSEFKLRHDLDRNREELETSNQKLRELDEAKNRFFANISHELRTPLTLLIAPLESLIQRTNSVNRPQEERDLMGTMHGNAMRLLKLINDLLDLVRLESGRAKVRARRVNVNEFIHGLATAVSPVAKDKRIQLHAHVDSSLGVVIADPEKLERICLNLLFNALKFTAASGRVNFSAMKEDNMLVIDVTDTGMGIPPDQLPNIFSRFWQADTSSQRKFQGMGIGLALVKELVEVQGGSVSATSEVGKGTTMSVRLPLQQNESVVVEDDEEEAHVQPGEEAPKNKDWIADLYRRAELFPAMTSLQATLRPVETSVGRSRKPKLLIADDEPDMLRFLKGQLSATFEVLEAVDGQQAVEKAVQFLPDIILSDMMMPEKDGLQVCRELRDRISTRSIPVVLLTARADEKTKLDCLAAGASDFLAKPFSLTEIMVRLKNLVDTRLYQKELVVQKQQLESALEQIKETESMLVRNEKLASLGRLSAGLIHEINNPLNYARQGLHIIARSTKLLPEEERADFTDTLKDVEDGVNRVIQIISDLRGFTRNTSQLNHSFDLQTIVNTGLRFFSHIWKEGIQREVDIPDELEVRGDSNQFVQVLINFIQNALDAMATKKYPEGETPCIKLSAFTRRDKVIFSVKDNGPGIPPDIRDKIFDPFFTTKDVGEGMGLGLAICNRIIADHGGRIDVLSQPGEYTEFILELPTTASTTNNHAAV